KACLTRISRSEAVGERLPVVLELERRDHALVGEHVVLVRQLAVALAELGRPRNELHALLGRRLVARDRRRDLRQLLLDALLRAHVGRDPRIDLADARFEIEEPAPRVKRGEKVGLELDRADAVIRPALPPDVEAAARPAVALDARVVPRAIALEVRRDAVLSTLLPISADRRNGPAGRAVLEADRAPVRNETRLLAHAGATGEREKHRQRKTRTPHGLAFRWRDRASIRKRSRRSEDRDHTSRPGMR